LNNAIIDQFLGLEAADLFVAGTKKTNNVAYAVDAGVDFSFVDAEHTLIPFFGIIDAFKTESFGQALDDLRLVFRNPNESHAIEQSFNDVFDRPGRRGDRVSSCDDPLYPGKRSAIFQIREHPEAFVLNDLGVRVT